MIENIKRDIDQEIAKIEHDREKDSIKLSINDDTSYDIYFDTYDNEDEKYFYIKMQENTADAPFYYIRSYTIKDLHELHMIYKVFEKDNLDKLKDYMKTLFDKNKITLKFENDEVIIKMDINAQLFADDELLFFELYREMIPEKEKDTKLLDIYKLNKKDMKALKQITYFINNFEGNQEEMKFIRGLKDILNLKEIPGIEKDIQLELDMPQEQKKENNIIKKNIILIENKKNEEDEEEIKREKEDEEEIKREQEDEEEIKREKEDEEEIKIEKEDEEEIIREKEDEEEIIRGKEDEEEIIRGKEDEEEIKREKEDEEEKNENKDEIIEIKMENSKEENENKIIEQNTAIIKEKEKDNGNDLDGSDISIKRKNSQSLNSQIFNNLRKNYKFKAEAKKFFILLNITNIFDEEWEANSIKLICNEKDSTITISDVENFPMCLGKGQDNDFKILFDEKYLIKGQKYKCYFNLFANGKKITDHSVRLKIEIV